MSTTSDEKPEKSLFGQWKEMQKENLFSLKPAEKAHLMGMWRQGLAESRSLFYTDSNIAQPTDYGIWGKTTPGEAADERNGVTPKDSNQEHGMSVAQLGNLVQANEVEPAQVALEAKSVFGEGRLQQRMMELESRTEPDRQDKEHER